LKNLPINEVTFHQKEVIVHDPEVVYFPDAVMLCISFDQTRPLLTNNVCCSYFQFIILFFFFFFFFFTHSIFDFYVFKSSLGLYRDREMKSLIIKIKSKWPKNNILVDGTFVFFPHFPLFLLFFSDLFRFNSISSFEY
jgi:hypothetical protein